MDTLKINGTSLAYRECGEGEPVVLVHGSGSDLRTWQEQQDELAENYRVISYSRRYHWPNQKIPEDADYTMAQHLADLRTMIQTTSAAPAHLVGHSYGAFLCLLLAIESPDLVRTMVLGEPPSYTLYVSSTPRLPEILSLLVRKPRTALAIMNFGTKGMAPARELAKRGDAIGAMRLFGKTILGPQFFSQLSKERLEQVDANATRAEFLGSGFPPLQTARVRELQIPALLITGKHSHPLFHRLADGLEELLPRVERIEFENASHIMHEDQPVRFNRAVQSFLIRGSGGQGLRR
jgi:pimeloyl-ACP methyl ester carboxylesterase